MMVNGNVNGNANVNGNVVEQREVLLNGTFVMPEGRRFSNDTIRRIINRK